MAGLAPLAHKGAQALQGLLDQLDVGERKVMLGSQEMLVPWVIEVTRAQLAELAQPALPDPRGLQEILGRPAELALLARRGRQALLVPLVILERAV